MQAFNEFAELYAHDSLGFVTLETRENTSRWHL